jgi:winged helix DNA-binding protein
VGLWTRLSGFTPDALKDLLAERSVVRAHLMRNTVHLVTAPDYLTFRPLFQPLMDRALSGPVPATSALLRFRNIRIRRVLPLFVPPHI